MYPKVQSPTSLRLERRQAHCSPQPPSEGLRSTDCCSSNGGTNGDIHAATDHGANGRMDEDPNGRPDGTNATAHGATDQVHGTRTMLEADQGMAVRCWSPLGSVHEALRRRMAVKAPSVCPDREQPPEF